MDGSDQLEELVNLNLIYEQSLNSQRGVPVHQLSSHTLQEDYLHLFRLAFSLASVVMPKKGVFLDLMLVF